MKSDITVFKKIEEKDRKWYLIDAKDKILGRLASRIEIILMGKRKPIYSPHIDVGDYVVVINSDKVKVTGNKEKKKIYYFHSFYPGGLKEISFERMRIKKPENIIYLAVKRMLPKNKLGRKMLKRLKIYAGENHPHIAQNPLKIEPEEVL
ncbi:MAG: 50S ribosomal protein L13 [candidate division WOR-3 bacterium]